MASDGTKGPVHLLDYGRYYAVIRDGVPQIERADTAGAVFDVEECDCEKNGTIHFDRSICACGSMHYFCEEHGNQVDPCHD